MVYKAPSQLEPYFLRNHSKSLMSKKTENAKRSKFPGPKAESYFFSNILAYWNSPYNSAKNRMCVDRAQDDQKNSKPMKSLDLNSKKGSGSRKRLYPTNEKRV